MQTSTPRLFILLIALGVRPVFAEEPLVEVSNTLGFHTHQIDGKLPDFWAGMKERHRMTGPVAETLTRSQVTTCVGLKCHLHLAFGAEYPTLADSLFAFDFDGNTFVGRELPEKLKRHPSSLAVAAFQTKSGEWGLLTLFSHHVLIEYRGKYGIARVTDTVQRANPLPVPDLNRLNDLQVKP